MSKVKALIDLDGLLQLLNGFIILVRASGRANLMDGEGPIPPAPIFERIS
jgi:hypothetical protein